MALVGNISGSTGVSSTIGISGSLIIANRPDSLFPSLPGNDVVLFVSGNIAPRPGGSPATSPDYAVRGTTVIGGDLVISGTLFGGSPLYIGDQIIARNGLIVTGTLQSTVGLSGSLTKLTDGTSYIIAGTNITVSTGSSGAITISSTAAAGGGGSNFFLDTAGAGKIYTTASSVAFPFGEAGIDEAADKGSNVHFYVSGSSDGLKTALFGGDVFSSGSLTLVGNLKANANTARTIFSDVTDITVGGASSVVNIAGDLKVSGNDIQASDSNVNITMTSNTLTEVKGDLQVTGNDIKMNGGTTAITFSGAGDVAVAGDLTVTGNDIKSLTATALTLAGANVTAAGNLTVTGDLTVNGTTTTIDTTNLLVEDPIILMASGAAGPNRNGGIAIFSGSADVTATGARTELVFGRVANDTWGAGKINTNNGSATDLTSMLLLPVRASKFEAGGTGAFLTSSNGNALTASAAASNPINFSFGGTSFAEILEAGVDAKFGASGNKNLILSGTSITMVAGTNGTIFQRDLNVVGSVSGVSTTSLTLAARTATGTATSLVLSGSGLTLGANSTVVDFQFGTGGGSLRGLASNTNGFTIGSQPGVNLNLSGSSNFLMRHGATGVGFQQHSLPYMTINSGSVALSANTALVTSDVGKAMLVGGSSTTIVSGSDIYLDASTNGITFRKDSTSFAQISSPAASTFTIAPAVTFTTANVVNTVATTVNFAGNATGVLNMGNSSGQTWISGSVTVPGTLSVQGAVTLGDAVGDNITFSGRAASDLVPNTNNAYDLGQPNLRWRNIYTGDLHLRNERGDWTIIEERDFLTITNNHSGKRYKFMLQEI